MDLGLRPRDFSLASIDTALAIAHSRVMTETRTARQRWQFVLLGIFTLVTGILRLSLYGWQPWPEYLLNIAPVLVYAAILQDREIFDANERVRRAEAATSRRIKS